MKNRLRRVARIFLTGSIIGLVLVITGCSFNIRFNIRNLSGETITVNYAVKNLNYGLAPLLGRKNFDENTEKYVPIPEDRIKIDTVDGIVEFKLLADEEVQLYWVGDRLDNDYEKDFNLKSLRIAEEDGSISLEGQKVFKSFRPVKKSWYAFGPEIIEFVFEYR